VTLIVVRHGRTASNAAGLLLGRGDPPLDDVGRAQVAAIVPLIGTASMFVSSPLLRSRETAAALAGGNEIVVDDRWIELDYGEYEGIALGALPPDVWATWRSDAAFAPPGGETLAALGERVVDACTSLFEAAAGGDVVVVTHVSPIKAAVAWALGVGIEVSWRMYVAPASVTRIACRAGGAPSLHSFNECPWSTGEPPQDA
jgi:probable phosphoglycerate mutase